jgi:uncharacterized repeat protein (TIGR01451 family)
MKELTVLLYCGLVSAISAYGATFTVTITQDSGPGSFRQALLDAEATDEPDTIEFNIAGDGPHTISPAMPLPVSTHPLVINGYSQPGGIPNADANAFSGVLKIKIDGSALSVTGHLKLHGGGSTVRGIAFTKWNSGSGLELNGGTANIVAGCLFGVDPSGTDAHGSVGLTINDSSNNRIGGTDPADRNVFSYNFAHGISIMGTQAANNIINGNLIGTDLTGTLREPNFGSGIQIQDAPGNFIGGLAAGARNIIGANGYGILITGETATGNIIQENYIGADVTGMAALRSRNAGISINSSATTVSRNLVSGNDGFGIVLEAGASESLVTGNRIGVNSTGGALPNGAAGIIIAGDHNRIGGTSPSEANIIANNLDAGVVVASGIDNPIRGNSIYGNGGSPANGIDLGRNGLTPNDAEDADVGANNLQNFPLITSALGSSSSITIHGTFNSAAAQSYDLDFYANTACATSGSGEGQVYLGRKSVNTDASGNAAFDVTLNANVSGRFMTATATDALGNSSEFSPCFEAALTIPPATLTVTSTDDNGPGSLRQAILDSNAHTSSENNRITFNIPGGGLKIIQPASLLPAFTQPVTIDGFSQPGASPNTQSAGDNAAYMIELDGSKVTGFGKVGLRFTIPNLIVQGLRITQWSKTGLELASSDCVVAGNFITANTLGGITVSGSGNRIGGTALAERNIISGNIGGTGIDISSGNGNVILGNLIGTDMTGTAAPGDQFWGVSIFDGSDNKIGDGTEAGANVIAFHSSDGISIQSGVNNSVRRNTMFSNFFGIDLGSDDHTPNDAGDTDTGANNLQNFPIITAATGSGDSTTIEGNLDSAPNTTFTLDFYSSTQCNNSGNGEGQFFLGSSPVSTDASGKVTFNLRIPAPILGAVLTATATDPNGSTSEFSPCFQPNIALPPKTFTVTNPNDSGPGSLRQAITDSAFVPNTGADRIEFNIPGAGPHRISLLTPLNISEEPLVIDGYTQPGAQPNTSQNSDNAKIMIQLDGSQGDDQLFGFLLTHNGNTIRGLSFTHFGGAGIVIRSDQNIIEGNWVGLDPSGATVANDRGIAITGSQNLIGGNTPAARNIISGNTGDGILLGGSTAPLQNIISGNFIGAGPNPDISLGNGGNGVRLTPAEGTTIGGDQLTKGNYISYNKLSGVSVESGRENGIFYNSTIGNKGKPISISPGANDDVKPPQITAAFSDAGGNKTHIEGSFQGKPNTTYSIALNVDQSAPGFPPHDLIGWIPPISVTTDAQGKATFQTDYQPVTADTHVVDVFGRATCSNSTSENSTSAAVLPGGTVDLQVSLDAPASGDVLTAYEYVMKIFNLGPAPATSVKLEQGLPPGLTTGAITSSQGTASVEGTRLMALLQTIPAGGNAQIKINVTPTAPGDFISSVQVRANEIDTNPANNKTDRETVIIKPNGQVDLRVEATLVEQPGAGIAVEGTYTVTVSNLGPDTASGVVSYHRLPKGSRVKSITSTKGTCSLENPIPECHVEVLQKGESYTVTVIGLMNHLDLWLSPDELPKDFYPYLIATTASEQRDIDLSNNQLKTLLPYMPPSLHVERAGGSIGLSFQDPASSLQLQSSTLSANANWQIIPPTSIQSQDGIRIFTTPPSQSAQFFRLVLPPPETPAVRFNQQALLLDHAFIPGSDWGSVDILVKSQPGVVQYFNLCIPGEAQQQPQSFSMRQNSQTNECWVLQNIPVTTTETNGTEIISINFPYNFYGKQIPGLTNGWSVTSEPRTNAPPATNEAPVYPFLTVERSGITNASLYYFPARPLVGTTVRSNVTAKPEFPNIEQGWNECAPSAILNSLMYLNTSFNLGISTNELTIDKMKTATGWGPDGAPNGDFGEPGSWADLKADYMRAHNLPIQTLQTADPKIAMEALAKGWDVEIRIDGHAAAVVAISDMESNDYAVTLSHDVLQGQEGGLRREINILDGDAGELYGSSWSADFIEFVIEKPSQ